MGHVPVSGEGGSLGAFDAVPLSRRIYVHLNNSNPLVDPASPERARAEAAGWQIGHDGMEIVP